LSEKVIHRLGVALMSGGLLWSALVWRSGLALVWCLVWSGVWSGLVSGLVCLSLAVCSGLVWCLVWSGVCSGGI